MFYFCVNDTATTETSPLPLHDALPISARGGGPRARRAEHALEVAAVQPERPVRLEEGLPRAVRLGRRADPLQPVEHRAPQRRSEEHTSELQSRQYLVCRLLLEKKK